MAKHVNTCGRVGYVEIDSGRIGGIRPAKRVADCAVAQGVALLNHAFTSHLALSTSLQPYAELREHEICEYPFWLKPLAGDLTSDGLEREGDGYPRNPDSPALGIGINSEAARSYLVDAEMRVRAKNLFSSSNQF